MNSRERLTRVYGGSVADRVPWAPLIFEDTLSLYSSDIREGGPIKFTEMIGGDVLWRVGACEIENDALRVVVREDENHIYKEYQTDIGSLHEVRRKNKSGGHRIEKWPIQKLSDFKIMEYILEHQVAKPDYENLLRADRLVGEKGIVIVFQTTSPVQSLIEKWIGLVKFYHFLQRHTSDLENLMIQMHEKNKETYEVMASSPIKVQCIIENTDIGLVSPRVYERYSLRHVRDFVDMMHTHDKIAFVHMCGKIRGLLPLIKKTGLDGIDCLTAHPTGDVDFRHVYGMFGNRFVIHGVLDPTNWLPNHKTAHDIKESIIELLKDIHGKPFILCTCADGIPGIPIGKFLAIGETMQKSIDLSPAIQDEKSSLQ